MNWEKLSVQFRNQCQVHPHEVLQVLDATTGQNAIEQCRQFSDVAKSNRTDSDQA